MIVGKSPWLRGIIPNPLSGPYLTWLANISDVLSGLGGSGDIVSNGEVVGSYKAVGGLVHAYLVVPASGTINVTFPALKSAGPLICEDGQTVWPDNSGNVTVTSTSGTRCYITYRG